LVRMSGQGGRHYVITAIRFKKTFQISVSKQRRIRISFAQKARLSNICWAKKNVFNCCRRESSREAEYERTPVTRGGENRRLRHSSAQLSNCGRGSKEAHVTDRAYRRSGRSGKWGKTSGAFALCRERIAHRGLRSRMLMETFHIRAGNSQGGIEGPADGSAMREYLESEQFSIKGAE